MNVGAIRKKEPGTLVPGSFLIAINACAGEESRHGMNSSALAQRRAAYLVLKVPTKFSGACPISLVPAAL